MKIGILFGDNDFGTTIEAFLSHLLTIKQNDRIKNIPLEEIYTKERIVDLFNNNIGIFYWINQNGLSYALEDFDGKKEYLNIQIKNVFINEEVDNVLKEDNDSRFHYIDLTTGESNELY